jgi:hypothetical protein
MSSFTNTLNLSLLRTDAQITTADEKLLQRLKTRYSEEIPVVQKRCCPQKLNQDMIVFEITRRGVSMLYLHRNKYAPRDNWFKQKLGRNVNRIAQTTADVQANVIKDVFRHDLIEIETEGQPIRDSDGRNQLINSAMAIDESHNDDETDETDERTDDEDNYRPIPGPVESARLQSYQDRGCGRKQFDTDYVLLLASQEDRYFFEYEGITRDDAGTVLPTEITTITGEELNHYLPVRLIQVCRYCGVFDCKQESERVALAVDVDLCEYRLL